MFRIVSLLVPLLVWIPAWGQTPADAIKQIAGKILAQLPLHSTISLAFENRSTLDAAEAEAVKTALEQQLRADGLEMAESETKLRIIVSEDPTRYLLIAQLGDSVDIVNWDRLPRPATEYRMSIKRAAVWEQRDPILDVKLSDAGSNLLVLESGRLVEYTKKDGAWQMDHATNIAAKTPLSRDPRGQIGADETTRWIPGRNYMDGSERGFFYTKAETGSGTLLAGIDGRTRLFGQKPEPLLAMDNWGSDIAAIESACGSRKQVLVTAPATDESQDRLQAFEVSTASYVPASEALPLAGPVTALWPSESPDQVTLVVHNSQTGMYEASRLSISCTQ